MIIEVDYTKPAKDTIIQIIRDNIPQLKELDDNTLLNSVDFEIYKIKPAVPIPSDDANGIYQFNLDITGHYIDGFYGTKTFIIRPAVLDQLFVGSSKTGTQLNRVDLTFTFGWYNYRWNPTEETMIMVAKHLGLPEKLYTNKYSSSRTLVKTKKGENVYIYTHWPNDMGSTSAFLYTTLPLMNLGQSMSSSGKKKIKINDLIREDEGIYRLLLGYRANIGDESDKIGYGGGFYDFIYNKKALSVDGDIIYESK